MKYVCIRMYIVCVCVNMYICMSVRMYVHTPGLNLGGQ